MGRRRGEACEAVKMYSCKAFDSRLHFSAVDGGHRVAFLRWSGYVSHAPLGLSFNGSLWFCRQLQNSRLLALTQCCQERDPAIRKFQCVVMRYDLAFVDLPKDRCLMLDYLIAPSYQARR